jgi:hypothetical protein
MPAAKVASGDRAVEGEAEATGRSGGAGGLWRLLRRGNTKPAWIDLLLFVCSIICSYEQGGNS